MTTMLSKRTPRTPAIKVFDPTDMARPYRLIQRWKGNGFTETQIREMMDKRGYSKKMIESILAEFQNQRTMERSNLVVQRQTMIFLISIALVFITTSVFRLYADMGTVIFLAGAVTFFVAGLAEFKRYFE